MSLIEQDSLETELKKPNIEISKLNIKDPLLLDKVLIDKKPEEIAFTFDADDTLRRRADGLIPPSAVEAIKMVRAAGYKTYIATGHSDVDKVIEKILDSGMRFDGFSCVNGQRVIAKDGGLIFSKIMSPKQIDTVSKIANKYNLGFVLSTDKGFILANKKEISYENLELLDKLNTSYVIDNNVLKYQVYNFSLICDTTSPNVEKFMKECELAGFASLKSNKSYFDVVLKDTTKATGIKQLKQSDNVKAVISFGDAMNDAEMFSNSDISVCVGNGVAEMKDKADIITEDLDKNGIKVILDIIKSRHEELMKK